MNKKNIIIIVISLIVFLSLIVGLYFIFLKNNNMIKSNTIIYGDFIILNGNKGELLEYDKTTYIEGYKGSYDIAYYINGSIKNNSTSTYKFIIITFNLYDKNNNNLGTAVCGLENVVGNQTYKFKAMSLTTTNDAKKVTSYKLKSIIAS